jgi:hypothetical protein
MLMNLRLLLLSILLLLLFSLPTLAQEADKTISWVASGPASGSYSPSESDYSLGLEGTQTEITFYQDRSVYTNLFNGLHLISLNLSGEGSDGSGNFHAPQYQNLTLAYSLGYDLNLANFAHLQPFVAYGIGTTSYSKSYIDADDSLTNYEEKNATSDYGIYGINLIFEITGKFWIGYGLNYFYENQLIEYEKSNSSRKYLNQSSIELDRSQTISLIYNWERIPIKAIDPKQKGLFGF